MNVFTQQELFHRQLSTPSSSHSRKIVQLDVYKVLDHTADKSHEIWMNQIRSAILSQIENSPKIKNFKLPKSSSFLPPFMKISPSASLSRLLSSSASFSELPFPKPSFFESSSPTIPYINPEINQHLNLFLYHYPFLIANRTENDGKFIKIWALDDHSVYKIIHQPYLLDSSIYILIFNINHDIHDKILLHDGQTINKTYLEFIQEQLTSIIGFNSKHRGTKSCITNIEGKDVCCTLPIVILVASNSDYIENENQQSQRFGKFEQELKSCLPHFAEHIYSSRLIFKCNPDKSSSILAKREQCNIRLYSIVKSFAESIASITHNTIPIRWCIMANILGKPITNEEPSSFINQIRLNRVKRVMTFLEIRSLAKEYGIYHHHDDLVSMLSYLNNLGQIIYYQTSDGDKVIVTEIDWLPNIIHDIISFKDYTPESSQMQATDKKTSRTGIISIKNINYALSRNGVDDSSKKNIISLMEAYDIIYCIKNYKNKDECQYLVPNLLQPDVQPLDLSQYHVSDLLYIGFKPTVVPYIPDTIFYRLLSLSLREWNTEVEFFYQCARCYLIDDAYYIIIKKDTSHISLQYCYQEAENHQVVTVDKVKNLIHDRKPHILIKSILSSIVHEKMLQFTRATCRFYIRCTKCLGLTTWYYEDEPVANRIKCSNCDELYESQSIDDWNFTNFTRENYRTCKRIK